MSQGATQIQTVVVLGGGSAGFLSALTLKRMLPELDVALVRCGDIPAIGVGEATTASIPGFLHNDLGLDRGEFYDAVRPSWKLGIRFQWGAAGGDDFHYPFRCGVECPAIFRRSGAEYLLDDWQQSSLYSVLMTEGKSPCFATPDGRYHLDESFGYHFDSMRLIAYLEVKTRQLGVSIHDRKVVDVDRQPGGGVAALRLDNGETIAADLYVDCSGFSSQLLGETLQEPYESYAQSLLCDTAVVGSWERRAPVLPYTTAQTMSHGWCWRIDLPRKVSRGYVFSSRFCEVTAAMDELKQANPELGDDIATVRFQSGRYRNFWVHNVAAIGNSAGFVEPLESTGLHMIMETLSSLAAALIDTDRVVYPAMRRLANAFIGQMWDDIRDFLAVHFKFNRRLDSAFWRCCREDVDLAGATQLVDFFQQAGPSRIGHMLLPRQSVFGARGYLALLAGQGVETSQRLDPTAVELGSWHEHLARVSQAASRALPMTDALAAVADPAWQWMESPTGSG